ncbi:MAG: metallophosphoesterase [Bacteroidia bacterium]
MNRRKFLTKGALGASLLLLPETRLSFDFNSHFPRREKLSFGIVADVHHGMMPDTNQRLEKFIEEAIEKEVDFIIQLGDFCHREEKSKPFLKTWNEFQKHKYHVLGNHDMDLSSKEDIMDFLEMPKSYYTFDEKGVRFIVLDANFLYQDGKFVDYNKGNFYVNDSYRTYINDEQIEWFSSELADSNLPVIVISHQSLWHYQWGVKNRLAIQKQMEKHQNKIICCMNGHNHIDFHHVQNGIHYIEINSMSYQWIGDEYKTQRYSSELLTEYKWLNHLAAYEEPLYAFASLNPKGSLEIKGKRSQWISPSPQEIGIPRQVYGNEYSPIISDYKIDF